MCAEIARAQGLAHLRANDGAAALTGCGVATTLQAHYLKLLERIYGQHRRIRKTRCTARDQRLGRGDGAWRMGAERARDEGHGGGEPGHGRDAGAAAQVGRLHRRPAGCGGGVRDVGRGGGAGAERGGVHGGDGPRPDRSASRHDRHEETRSSSRSATGTCSTGATR